MTLVFVILGACGAGAAASLAHRGEDPGNALAFGVLFCLLSLYSAMEDVAEKIAKALRERK